MSRQRRWTSAVLLRGRLLEIEARERYVLSSLRAFNHPELRGVSSRVWRPSQTSNCWLNRKQQWSVFSGKRVDFYAPPLPAIGRLEASLFCVYIRWGAERMRSLDLSGRHRRRHRRRRLLWPFCRQAAWRHGAIGCRTMSSFRNIRDRGGAGPNEPLSSCLAGVAMCCKRQAAWRW